MRRLRILYITACGEGGVADCTCMLSRHLSGMGMDVTVAGPPNTRLAADIRRLPGVEFIEIPIKKRIDPLSDWSCFSRLRRIIGSSRFDIVHSNSSKAGFLTSLIRPKSSDSKFVYSPHCTVNKAYALGPLRRPLSVLECWAARRNEVLIACCDDEKKGMRDSRMNLNGNIEMVYNGVENPGSSFTRKSGGSYPVIGVLARMVKQKGLDYLIRVLRRVLADFPDCRVSIAGDGPLEDELRALATAEGVADRIEFLGYVDDCYSYLAGIDVFVLPSRWEAFPLSILQAGYAGVPVITTSVGGIPELIDDSTGWPVPPNDLDSLHSAVVQCLSDREKSFRRATKLQELVSDKYNAGRMAKETYDIYCSRTDGTV